MLPAFPLILWQHSHDEPKGKKEPDIRNVGQQHHHGGTGLFLQQGHVFLRHKGAHRKVYQDLRCRTCEQRESCQGKCFFCVQRIHAITFSVECLSLIRLSAGLASAIHFG